MRPGAGGAGQGGVGGEEGAGRDGRTMVWALLNDLKAAGLLLTDGEQGLLTFLLMTPKAAYGAPAPAPGLPPSGPLPSRTSLPAGQGHSDSPRTGSLPSSAPPGLSSPSWPSGSPDTCTGGFPALRLSSSSMRSVLPTLPSPPEVFPDFTLSELLQGLLPLSTGHGRVGGRNSTEALHLGPEVGRPPGNPPPVPPFCSLAQILLLPCLL